MSARPQGVIVVEDDPGMSQAMARMLRVTGFEPLVFPSAEELLKAGAGRGAICMVIDVQLPGLNGFELHERLCATGPVPPAIFITAFEEPDLRSQAATRAGAFLAKPFSGHTLIETVRRVIGARQVESSS